MKKIKIIILLSLINIQLSSCSSQSRSTLIIGSWSASYPKENMSMVISFIDRHTATITSTMESNSKTDTMEYKLSDNKKRLITTEKSGAVQDLEIIELTTTDLVLYKAQDTLHLHKK